VLKVAYLSDKPDERERIRALLTHSASWRDKASTRFNTLKSVISGRAREIAWAGQGLYIMDRDMKEIRNSAGEWFCDEETTKADFKNTYRTSKCLVTCW